MTPRMTLQTQLVLRLLLDASDHEMYGLDVINQSSLSPGTVYPIMQRLEAAGWVTARWQPAAEHQTGPPRRYYKLTREGAARATHVLAGNNSKSPMNRLFTMGENTTAQEEG